MSSPGYIDEGLPSSAKSKVSDLEIQGKPIYLGLDVDSKNKVIASYACFIRNETEYCIKAASDDSTYETNVEIIKYAYEDVVNTNACSFDEEVSSCRVDELSVSAYSYGDVTVYADSVLCMFTNDYNTFECFDA